MSASSQPGLNPLTQLTPGQVNAAESAQWRQAIRQALTDARCATPAFLTADMDPVTQTVTAQIALQERVRTNTGPQWMDIPPIIMVPVCVPRGGGWAFTLPLKKGDEGLLIFCDTCFDFWWTSGQTNSPAPTYPKGAASSGSQRQNEMRRHALHDCGFYPGMWSQKNLLPNYSTTSAQLRCEDGATTVLDLTLAKATLTAPAIDIKAHGGIPQALVNDTWFQWYVTDIMPFLNGLGYSGPPVPTGSETTVLKGQ